MLPRLGGLHSCSLVRGVIEGCLGQRLPGVLSNRRVNTGTELKPLDACEAGSTLDRAQTPEGGS